MNEAEAKKSYAEKIAAIIAHLESGGIIMVGSYTKPRQFEGAKCAGMFKVASDGSPLMQVGHKWVDIRWTPVKTYRRIATQ